MAAPESLDKPFDLKGDSADFRTKKVDVFGSLDDIEKSYQSNLAVRSEDDKDAEADSSELRDDAVSNFDDGGFKRPRSPGRSHRSAYSRRREFRTKAWSRREDSKWRNNKTADFEQNPAKWKRYSLEETSVCGNTQNSRVAFDLIRQLKQRREEGKGTNQDSAPADLGQKIVFSKPEAKADITERQESCSEVHKMQEYNFGVKVARRKDHRPAQAATYDTKEHSSSGVTLSLQHLEDEVTGDRPPDVLPTVEDNSDPSQAVNPEENVVVCSDTPTPAVVGFKKRKGKRNVRHRQEEQDD